MLSVCVLCKADFKYGKVRMNKAPSDKKKSVLKQFRGSVWITGHWTWLAVSPFIILIHSKAIVTSERQEYHASNQVLTGIWAEI